MNRSQVAFYLLVTVLLVCWNQAIRIDRAVFEKQAGRDDPISANLGKEEESQTLDGETVKEEKQVSGVPVSKDPGFETDTDDEDEKPASPMNCSSELDSTECCNSFDATIEWIYPNFTEEGITPDRDSAYEAETSDTQDQRGNKTWRWNPKMAADCGLKAWTTEEARELLQDTHIVVAGDSQARSVFKPLLQLLMPDETPSTAKHSDFHHRLVSFGIKLDYLWGSYAANISSSLHDLERNGTCPDVFVTGIGLWHMLWSSDAQNFAEHLRRLKGTTYAFLSSEACTGKFREQKVNLDERNARMESQGGGQEAAGNSVWNRGRKLHGEWDGGSSPPNSEAGKLGVKGVIGTSDYPFFWVDFPRLNSSLMNTDRKRLVMTVEAEYDYRASIERSGILVPEGPFHSLGLEALSIGCGPECTADGIHYTEGVYSAVVQSLLNRLSLRKEGGRT